MDIINVGFRSKKWRLLNENSGIKSIQKSLDEENAKVCKHIINSISNLLEDDYNNAYREAHLALKHSEGMDSPESEETKCPFCQGVGYLEFQYQNDPNDPSDMVEEKAPCEACNGEGTMNAYDLLTLYDGSDRPERVIENIVRGNMTQAKELAQEITNTINSHYDEVFEKSVDRLR